MLSSNILGPRHRVGVSGVVRGVVLGPRPVRSVAGRSGRFLLSSWDHGPYAASRGARAGFCCRLGTTAPSRRPQGRRCCRLGTAAPYAWSGRARTGFCRRLGTAARRGSVSECSGSSSWDRGSKTQCPRGARPSSWDRGVEGSVWEPQRVVLGPRRRNGVCPGSCTRRLRTAAPKREQAAAEPEGKS